MQNKNIPNFLVIGVEKGGTTWLHAQLIKHPDIFVPATKEVHFFNKYSSNFVERDNYKLGWKWYEDFFSKYAGQKAVGEVTPMYICDPEAAKRIKKDRPDVKLIVMLRNPVNRAYSHYWMALNKSHVNGTFDDVVDREEEKIIKRGLYTKQLETYFELFSREQIKVVFFEEVMKEPEYWLAEICRFLSVDAAFYEGNEDIHKKVYEASAYKSPLMLNIQNNFVHKLRRIRLFGKIMNKIKSAGLTDIVKKANRVEQTYPPISKEQAERLNQYYQDDLLKLSEILQVKLPYL